MKIVSNMTEKGMGISFDNYFVNVKLSLGDVTKMLSFAFACRLIHGTDTIAKYCPAVIKILSKVLSDCDLALVTKILKEDAEKAFKGEGASSEERELKRIADLTGRVWADAPEADTIELWRMFREYINGNLPSANRYGKNALTMWEECFKILNENNIRYE